MSEKKDKKKKPKTLQAPPKDCSEGEYTELLATASSLTEDEAKAELIECARYGELDAVRALLEVWSKKISDYVNTTDGNGSTALHKSSASGHVTVVQLLLFNKAKHLINISGKNTPLHWAAANGHEVIVDVILCHDFEEELDVLLKNQAGRSILTEGFSSKNTKLVGMLLEHDSATEDKLLQGGKEVDEDEDDDMKGKKPKKESITHEFDFLRDATEEGKIDTLVESNKGNSILGDGEERKTLLIRELPIENADNPFDEGEDKLDTTGLCIWAASLVMARWMASKAILGRFDGKNVLELGAGCGVPGLALAQYSDASLVYITDYNPVTMDNLKYNIDINANRPCTQSRAGDWLERVKAASIDWSDESTWPKEKMDYIIGSDLIYQKSIVPLLKKVVNGLMKDDGRFLYTCPSDGRDGLVEFISSMKKEGFRCTSEEIAPPLYTSNPLSDGDDDDVILHFYELPITEYKLFEFKKE